MSFIMSDLNYIPTGLQFRQTFEMLKLNTPPPAGVVPPVGSIFGWVEVPIIGTGDKKKFKYRDETGQDRDFVDNTVTQEQLDLIAKIGETDNGDLVFNGNVFQSPKPYRIKINNPYYDGDEVVDNSVYDSLDIIFTNNVCNVIHNSSSLVNCELFDNNNNKCLYPITHSSDLNHFSIELPEDTEIPYYVCLIGYGSTIKFDANLSSSNSINNDYIFPLLIAFFD